MMQRTIDSTEWRWVFISSGLLMLAISVPYIWAYAAAIPDYHFMGILVNPADGYSYLARMYQGHVGSWLFHLPYTPEPHQGVFLHAVYLGIGHLAREIGVSTTLTFHALRLLAGLYMLLVLYLFVADRTDDVVQRRITWGLAAVGSGFGWLVMLLGQGTYITPDLSTPEAFPLYSAYASVHLPWAIALLAWMAHALVHVLVVENPPQVDFNRYSVGLAAATLILVTISPLAVLPLGLSMLVVVLWKWRCARSFPWREAAWATIIPIFGLPLMAYNAWAISSANPVFHAWALQSATLSLPVWDYLIAYGPFLIMAGTAIWASRRALDGGDVFLLAWLAINSLLLYVPTGAQRHFALGLILPMAIYAGRGLWRVIVPLAAKRWRPVLLSAILILSVPTTLIAIVTPVYGITTRDAGFYYTHDEYEMLVWLDQHTEPESLILASPGYSLLIPTVGDRRVVYAHPLETLHAEEREEAVMQYYLGLDCSVVEDEGVDYIIFGPRESRLLAQGESSTRCLPSSPPIHQVGEIAVYAAP
jgi:hypothetical protein